MTYVVKLCGGIGNIIQTTPFMLAMRERGHKVVGRISWDPGEREASMLVSPACDWMVSWGQPVSCDVIEEGILMDDPEGKHLLTIMPEWAARFVYHGIEPPSQESVRTIVNWSPYPNTYDVVFAPTGKPNWPMKRWPWWNDLIAMCPGAAVVGLEGDGGELKGDFVDLRGKFSLHLLAGILRWAKVAVCQESGAAHISCAVGTKTIILYGGTDPVKNLPPRNAVPLMAEGGFPCRPCQHRGCHQEMIGGVPFRFGCHPPRLVDGFAQCMYALSPERVREEMMKLLMIELALNQIAGKALR